MSSRKWSPIDRTLGIYETKLTNGLKVICLERHHLPIVTVMTAYRIGGAHLFQGKTGLAHFLEHMMFKGTKQFPKGKIDHLTQKWGGVNNAFTTLDYTCYFFTFASDHWEKALEIEADRMSNCLWSELEFENEKRVILEELSSSMDSPYEVLEQKLDAVTFARHPYRNPILGWREDLENLTLKDLQMFYKELYTPNNAVITLVGNFSKENSLNKIHRYFSTTPLIKSSLVSPQPVEPQGKIHLTLKQDVEVARFQILFHTCPTREEDDRVLDIIDILLTYGRSSRLYRRLVQSEKLLQNVYSMNDTRKQSGIFLILGDVCPGVQSDIVEKTLEEELKKLQSKKVGKNELLKAKNIVLTGFVFQQETTYDMAEQITEMEMLGGQKDFSEDLGLIQSISEDDIQRVAKKYFDFSLATVGWSVPKSKGVESSQPKQEKMKTLRGIQVPLSNKKFLRLKPSSHAQGIGDVQQHTLDNGLTILLLENSLFPTVSMEASVRCSFSYEDPIKSGSAYLMGRLLSEGTKKRSAHKIACQVEYLGAAFNTSASRVSIRSLSRDFNAMCELTAEIIREPKFSQEDLEEEKRKTLFALLGQKDSASYLARNEFYRLVYGKHPFARPVVGNETSIPLVQQSDIHKLHSLYYAPNNLVVSIAGDISMKQAIDSLGKYFGSWSKKQVLFPSLPKLSLAKSPKKRYIPLDKQQLNIYWGHLGIRRNCPDYYALMILDHILGVGSGFTDRLSKTIRDDLGLVYNIWGTITANAGIEPGTFTVFLATDPEHYHKAMNTLEKEIEKICLGEISEEELADAQACITGNFFLARETNSALAEYLINAYRFNLGFDYLERFGEIIKNVSLEEVIAAANKYLHPEKATTVIAGPVDRIAGSVDRVAGPVDKINCPITKQKKK